MSWRFKRRRRPDGGFALLDTMIAFAIVSLVIVAGYTAASSALSQGTRVAERYALSEFAAAVLVQYVVTYPDTPADGTYRNRFAWRIVERPFVPAGLAQSGLDIHYRAVEVTVWERFAPERTLQRETITSRRGPPP